MDELEALILEQQKEMRHSHKVWPEFRDTISIDRLKDMFLELDSNGTFPYFENRSYNIYGRNRPRTGLRRNKPHGTRCTRHPGQERRTPKGKLRADGKRDALGQVYCEGCRKEYRERYQKRLKGDNGGSMP